MEPNLEMLNEGKLKLKKFNSIRWIKAKAENIPDKDNYYDYYLQAMDKKCHKYKFGFKGSL